MSPNAIALMVGSGLLLWIAGNVCGYFLRGLAEASSRPRPPMPRPGEPTRPHMSQIELPAIMPERTPWHPCPVGGWSDNRCHAGRCLSAGRCLERARLN